MIEQIQRFLNALDTALIAHAAPEEHLSLYPIGRAALILQYGMQTTVGATNDIDVVQIGYPPSKLAQKALDLFGDGTPDARRLGLHLELVSDGLPPLAPGFEQRSSKVAGSWQVIRVWKLEAHDLAVSKLKRFSPKDRQDLQFLCDEGYLRADRLHELLQKAFIWTTDKDGDPNREQAFAGLKRVQLYIEGKSRTL